MEVGRCRVLRSVGDRCGRFVVAVSDHFQEGIGRGHWLDGRRLGGEEPEDAGSSVSQAGRAGSGGERSARGAGVGGRRGEERNGRVTAA